jgi:hypothetical protein
MAFYEEMKLLLSDLSEDRKNTQGKLGDVEFVSLSAFLHEQFEQLPNEYDFKTEQRVVAIGDIHGDLLALLVALRATGVIDAMGHWIGNNVFVVLVGDLLDKTGRGVKATAYELEELDILQFIYFQNKQLVGTGGIRAISGNHEYMNFQQSSNNYEHPVHVNGWGGNKEKRELFSINSKLSNYFARQIPIILRINNYIFIHGGLDISHVEELCSLPSCNIIGKINTEWTDYLQGKSDRSNMLIDILHTRIFSSNSAPACTSQTSSNCRYTSQHCHHIMSRLFERMHLDLSTGGMIIGHTVQKRIQLYCHGNVWRIDVGLSSAFGNDDTGSVLLITLNHPAYNKRSTVDVITYQTMIDKKFSLKVSSYLQDKRIGIYEYTSEWHSAINDNPRKYNIHSPLDNNSYITKSLLTDEKQFINLPNGNTKIRVLSRYNNHIVYKQTIMQL